MIPKRRMTEQQTAKLTSLTKMRPKTGKAYSIVTALDAPAARQRRLAFNNLYTWMRRCRLQPIKNAATTLRSHKQNILAYSPHYERRL